MIWFSDMCQLPKFIKNQSLKIYDPNRKYALFEYRPRFPVAMAVCFAGRANGLTLEERELAIMQWT